ncbi:Ig-like domain-containing protein [Bacillus timonensis]|nr:Ig-like domain-containing protein [Bacillus timonensis]
MISKSYRKNKSVFWIPIAIVLVLSVLFLNLTVFSSDAPPERIVTFENKTWNISDQVSEPTWKTNSSNIEFSLDLRKDYEAYVKKLNDENKLAETTISRPFNVVATYNGTEIGNINYSESELEGEKGKFLVDFPISANVDGNLEIKIDFSGNAWGIPTEANTDFTIERDVTPLTVVAEYLDKNGEYQLFDPLLEEQLFEQDTNIRFRIIGEDFTLNNVVVKQKKDEGTEEEILSDKSVWDVDGETGNTLSPNKFINETGNYIFTVSAVDNIGNVTNETFKVALRKQDPEISLPETNFPGFYSGNVEVKVNNDIKINDAYADFGNGKTEKLSIKRKTASLVIAEEGVYNLKIIVEDRKGSKTLTVNSFTIDTTPPELALPNVIDNGAYKELTNIKLEETDKNLDLSKTEVIVTGPDKNEKLTNDDLYKDLSFTSEGDYKIQLIAQDLAGNTTNTQLQFTIDKTPPALTIEGIKDGGYYKPNTSAIVSVEDVTLNPENIDLDIYKGAEQYNDNFNLVFENETEIKVVAKPTFTEAGIYKISLSATDRAGNQISYENQPVTITIDDMKPQVYVKKPIKDGENTTWEDVINREVFSGPQNLEVSITDDYLESAEVIINQNGSEISKYNPEINGNVATVQHEFKDDGVYDIIVTSTDKAGNSNDEYNLTVIIDKDEKPSFEIIGVENDQHYSETEKEVTFKVKDFSLNPTLTKLKITRINGSEKEETEVGYEDWSFFDQILWLVRGEYVHTFNKEGTYTLLLESTDYNGNTSTQTILFTLDWSPPEIKIDTDIKDGSYVQKGKQVRIKVNELNYKTNKVDVIVTRDGEGYKEFGEWNNEVEGYVLSHTFNQDGNYIIEVNAEDKALNRAVKKTLEFTVDNKEPEIEIVGIDEGSYYSNSQTATIKIKELNFNKDLVSVDINGSQYKIDKWIKSKDNIYSYDIPFNNDGDYILTIHSKDDATNSAEKKIKFTIDKNPPVTKINGVAHMTNYKSDRNVEFIASDTNLAGTSLHVTKNGKPFDVGSLTKSGGTASLNYNFNEEGSYVLNFNATDKSGNKTTHDEIAFIIDKTNPVVKIDGVDHQSFNPTGKRVTVSVDELNFGTNYVLLSVTKDGKVFNIGTWQNKNKLSSLGYNFNDDGLYTVAISAEDKAGNGPIAANKTFTIDTTKPTIEITGVENAAHYNVDKPVNVVIRDVNLDVNRITVTRNGRGYNAGGFAVANQTARLSHNFSQEGDYVINVEAIDKAGNQFSNQIAFTIDKTAPVITPKFKGQSRVIKDGEYINEVFTPEFALDQADDTIVSVTMNGSNVTDRIPTASLEMTYKYSVLARDKAGNESTIDISFILDTTRPTLNITGVIDGFFNKNQMPTVTYSDRYLDTSRTRVTLNGRPFVNGLQLSDEGDYILKAEIYDLANNVSSRTIVFTIDKTAPVIKFKEAISEQYFKESLLPELLIEDLNAYDIISQTLNGQPYNLGDPIEEEGKHVLFFEVKDKAGNIQQLSVEFIIDKTPPKVNFEGVKKNETYRDPVTLSISLDNPSDSLKSVKINGELFTGDVKEVNGTKVVTVTLSDINKYKVEVLAFDDAGNENNEIVEFEIVEKSVLVKFYENKTLFAGTMVGLVGAAAAGAVALRRNIIRRRDEKDM